MVSSLERSLFASRGGGGVGGELGSDGGGDREEEGWVKEGGRPGGEIERGWVLILCFARTGFHVSKGHLTE